MKHGMYSVDGPDERLWCKSALLQDDPDNKENYLAQFDAMHLFESHGWHSVCKKHFVNVE